MSEFARLNRDGLLSDEIDARIADRDELIQAVLAAERAIADALKPSGANDAVDELSQAHGARSAALMEAAFNTGFERGRHDAEVIAAALALAQQFTMDVFAAMDRLRAFLGRARRE